MVSKDSLDLHPTLFKMLMRKFLISFCSILIFNGAWSQKTYSGLGIGGIYAHYQQEEFDVMKRVLSDSLNLKGQFLQNVNSPGISLSLFKALEKKFQVSLNAQFMFLVQTEEDDLNRIISLGQYSSNFMVVGGMFFEKWLRLDGGIGVNYTKLVLRESGNFYGEESKVTDNYINLYLSPSFELLSKEIGGGISIAPFYSVGVNKFDHGVGFGTFIEHYNQNINMRLNAVGIDIKFIFCSF